MSDLFNLKFLEEKLGEFNKDLKYPRISLIEGSFIYVEKNTKKELNEEINRINYDDSINPVYIWGYVSEYNAIYLSRTFGENKSFIYNPQVMSRSEFVKGKLKVINGLERYSINDLFDQKAVFNYFYKKLWDLRLELGKNIRDNNGIADNLSLMEAQYIIDRIIFIYFICGKNLISIKGGENLSGKKLFSGFIGQSSKPYFYLKEMFFKHFAEDSKEPLNIGGVLINIPYLNGGLFRDKKIGNISQQDLKIDYDWNKIFNILNKYNWMIDNNIMDYDDENEGNITPEILGHIYEKFVISIEKLDDIKLEDLKINDKGMLKEGNRKIGAYYTPEHITDFISKNAINSFLFGENTIADNNNFVSEIFINSVLNQSFSKSLLDKLNSIKICDPSCGSGAFLLKAGEILLQYKKRVCNKLNLDFEEYNLKKEIIINNLYGVDLKEGAIEICKLRLWLWLISSKFEKIDTLPNIEYNFILGNSLFGCLEEKLVQKTIVQVVDKETMALFDALKIIFDMQIINKIIELLNSQTIENFTEAIYYLKSLYSNSSGLNAEYLKKTIDNINSKINREISAIYKNKYNNERNNVDLFHWRSEFYKVMNNGGFDLVIGNPPYGKILTDSEKDLADEIYKSKRNDIAALFVERSINLLNSGGYLGYIITNAITFSKEFSKVREMISNNFQQCHISSFDRDKCRFFDGMTLSVAILSCFNKKQPKCEFYTSKMYRQTPELSEISYQLSNEFNIGEKLGVSYSCEHRVAKIGNKTSLSLINKLSSFEYSISEVFDIVSDKIVWIRTSGNYWYNSWNKQPYENSKIKSYGVKNEYDDLIISIINSSIFYYWMRVYGNGRDLNLDILKLFPVVEYYLISSFKQLLSENVNRLMKYLFKNFDEKKNRFSTSNVKPIIDLSDILIGKLYGMSNDEIKYILNYDQSIRKGQQASDVFFVLFDFLLYLTENNKEGKFNKEFEYMNQLLNRLADENYLDITDNEKSESLKHVEDIFKDYNYNNELNLEIIKNYHHLLKTFNLF
ncbi:MAG: Eco57I restriction-modification methylase domain-containing protein [Methanobrevibacter sp.]|jgi:hypothetical protein|nr:Eco57I restriction-modification methylase domain-containing protein [Candidatus Methanovirga meridionalis]